jgi:hypothetical protein
MYTHLQFSSCSCTQDRTQDARLLRIKKLKMLNCGQSVSSLVHECIQFVCVYLLHMWKSANSLSCLLDTYQNTLLHKSVLQ